MEQKYVDENKKEIYDMINEISAEFKAKKSDYLPKEKTVKEGEVVVKKAKKTRIPRYGYTLKQDGENYVFEFIKKLSKILQEKYGLDKYEADCDSTDIICEYVLPHVFENLGIDVASKYDKIRARTSRNTVIKMIGVILLIVFVIIVIIMSILEK